MQYHCPHCKPHEAYTCKIELVKIGNESYELHSLDCGHQQVVRVKIKNSWLIKTLEYFGELTGLTGPRP